MPRRTSGLFLMVLLCTIAQADVCTAADPEVKTGEKQDTLLYVRTVPPGAKVLLDGKELGTSDGVFHVEPGVGTVLVELDGHKPNKKQVTIRANGITRVELALKPQTKPESSAQFGPVIERAVNDDYPETNNLIDFDTGKLFTPSEGAQSKTEDERMAWLVQNGIDACCDTDKAVQGLMGFDMIAIPKASEEWDRAVPPAVQEQLAFGKTGTPAVISGKGELPATYFFKTREGGMGVLQIVGFTDKPKAVKIRYKLVQGKPQGEPAQGQIRNGTENILTNAGIEKGDVTPDDWEQGAEIDGVTYSWDKAVALEGKASLCIEKTANRYFPIAQWSQTVERTGDAPIVEVSAQVKAEKMTKAILDVVFLDKDDQWISHQWAAYIGSKKNGQPPANHDWKRYSGKVKIPPKAAKLCIALQVYGPGKVWFDDVRARYGK